MATKLAAVDHAVYGEISRSNCTGQALGGTYWSWRGRAARMAA